MKTTCIFLLISLLSCINGLYAQKQFTISGYVRDANTGEDLIAATVTSSTTNDDLQGTVTNAYGFYSLKLTAGTRNVHFSYVGYNPQVFTIDLQKDTVINIQLSNDITLDSTIEITAERADKNVESTQMGTLELPIESAKKLPALLGEVDIIKTMQLLPGVRSAGEGNAGFYVRGGSIDQNLILLDEAVVYNTGHLLGFFSIFNADAIKNATLIKGGMPANYGGRLSSVLDIQMKDGNNEYAQIEGGIGIVASRLTVQSPIVKKKASFIASGRRTYVFDLAQPFLKNTKFEGTNYYFYDLNLKANWHISQKDRLFVSGYFGRDVLALNQPQRNFNFNMNWGNATTTIRWNHLFSANLFMNAMVLFNNYDFAVWGGQEKFTFKSQSGIVDWSGKVAFDFYPNPKHSLKWGADYTYHTFTPSITNAFAGEEKFTIAPDRRYAHEAGIYILDNWIINKKFSINVGVRGSTFQQVGKYQSKLDSTRHYAAGEPVKTYFGIEPRLSGKITTDKTSSVKFGVTVGNQYIHLVSNSATTLPTDIWVPSSEIVRPQIGIQYAVGYFRNFQNNMLEASVEAYYKDLYNQLDYSERFTQTVDADVEDHFIRGRGRAYGVELLLRKNTGKLTGWVGYTWSRSFRTFQDIAGNTYPTRFDRPHDISVVANYDINARWNVGATFVYGSGSPYTPIKSIYLVNFSPVMEYGLRNSARLPAYHRLDLSVSYKLNKRDDLPFTSTLIFSIYNVYNRKNVFFTYSQAETDARSGSVALKSYQVSLFPAIPSVTWNFIWKKPRLRRKNTAE